MWAPDGNRIVFNKSGGGLTVIHADRSIGEQPLPVAPDAGVKIAVDWSSDGRFVMYRQFDREASTTDLWALPMDGDRKPLQLTASIHDERDGQFSPDGQWIAFESDESSEPAIYVQPFPGPDGKVRASVGGGTQVRWRRDGRELFYGARDNRLMAAPVSVTGAAIEIGTPVPRFKTSFAPMRSISRQQYVVSTDGQRFLIFTSDEQPLSPLTILLNWTGAR